jgi:outer membrane protein TolC
MRWKAVVVGLMLGVAGVAGCSKQCFIHECDYDNYAKYGFPDLECKPGAPPITPDQLNTTGPRTIMDPEAKIRYISLAEALAIALEQGTVGVQSPFFPGSITDTLVQFTGQGVAGSDAIRVLALDPAIIQTDMEVALSKFDVRWTTSMTWNTTDRPVGTALDQFQAQGRTNAIQTNDAQFNTSLLKPLPTGGVAGITFRTDYELTNLPARVNPSYRPLLQFNFEQPLLQNYGVEINQLLTQHPNSVLAPFRGLQHPVDGIVLTRLRFDQQRAEFERNLNFMLVNVEIAYWKLYGAYWTLYSREAALHQGYTAWNLTKQQYEAGKKNVADYAQSRGQYELFRGQRITALGTVLEQERQLRGLLGMPVEDGVRLVPSDSPTLAPYHPDWGSALNEALSLRPELILARQDVKRTQLQLIREKNQLLPDLRFTSTYDINGLGNRLDGPDDPVRTQINAFRSLAGNNFNDWSIGLRLDMPIGFREAHASIRAARLNLARSYLVLRDQEDKAQRYLALQYRQLDEFYEQIRAQRALREATAIQLETRFSRYKAGAQDATLDILLEAQRLWADALQGEFNAIVQYNNSLASFQFAKGTIQQYDNVVVSEGPLPGCAQVRAVEHERQRTLACLLRERPVPQVPCCGGQCGGGATIPALPAGSVPSIPAMMQGQPLLPDVPEQLPLPSTAPPAPTAPAPRPAAPGRVGAATPERLPDMPPAFATPAAATAPWQAASSPTATAPKAADSAYSPRPLPLPVTDPSRRP